MHKKNKFYILISIVFLTILSFIILLQNHFVEKNNVTNVSWHTIASKLCGLTLRYPANWEQFDTEEKLCLLSFQNKADPSISFYINQIRPIDGTIADKEKELQSLATKSTNIKTHMLMTLRIAGNPYNAFYQEDLVGNSSLITYIEKNRTVFYTICKFPTVKHENLSVCKEIVTSIQ